MGSKFTDVNIEFQKLSSDCIHYLKQIDELASSNRLLEAALKDLGEERKVLKNALDMSHGEIAGHVTRIAELEGKLDYANSKLQPDIEEYKSTIKTLEKDLDFFKSVCNLNHNEITKHTARIAELEDELDIASDRNDTDYNKLIEEHLERGRKIEELEINIINLRGEFCKLQQGSNHTKVQELTNELVQKGIELFNIAKEKEILKCELVQARKDNLTHNIKLHKLLKVINSILLEFIGVN